MHLSGAVCHLDVLIATLAHIKGCKVVILKLKKKMCALFDSQAKGLIQLASVTVGAFMGK